MFVGEPFLGCREVAVEKPLADGGEVVEEIFFAHEPQPTDQ